MNTCKECIHAEMCKWIDELEGRGCDFFDGEQEPSRKGHWIKERPWLKVHCSECGKDAIGNHGFDELKTDFCPNCGADMRGKGNNV